jgi:hypothetical protein
MNSITIESSSESGIKFYSGSEKLRTIFHEVDIETLKQMTLSDLEYCISINCFVEMKDIHFIFKEYLWSDDGRTPPTK